MDVIIANVNVKTHQGVLINQMLYMRVVIQKQQIITVHKDAILKMQGLTMSYVVAEDNTAQIRSIELGDATSARFEVLSGLSPGEPVVIRGNERLRPGQSVRIGIEENNSEEAGGNE